MKFDMDYIAHHNELTEFNPYFKLFLTIFLLILTLALDNLIIFKIFINSNGICCIDMFIFNILLWKR